MFVYSVRSSSVKFFAIVALTLVVLIALILSGGTVFASAEPVGTPDFSGISTKEDRIAFLEELGFSVIADSERSAEFVMPENFDRVIEGYNQIQKSQGFDISKYAKKKVTRYTYTLESYQDFEGEVEANILLYRNRVIACDISSTEMGGFVAPAIKK